MGYWWRAVDRVPREALLRPEVEHPAFRHPAEAPLRIAADSRGYIQRIGRTGGVVSAGARSRILGGESVAGAAQGATGALGRGFNQFRIPLFPPPPPQWTPQRTRVRGMN